MNNNGIIIITFFYYYSYSFTSTNGRVQFINDFMIEMNEEVS